MVHRRNKSEKRKSRVSMVWKNEYEYEWNEIFDWWNEKGRRREREQQRTSDRFNCPKECFKCGGKRVPNPWVHRTALKPVPLIEWQRFSYSLFIFSFMVKIPRFEGLMTLSLIDSYEVAGLVISEGSLARAKRRPPAAVRICSIYIHFLWGVCFRLLVKRLYYLFFTIIILSQKKP